MSDTGIIGAPKARIVSRVFLSRRLFGATMRLVGTILRRFFIDQFIYDARLKLAGLRGAEATPGVKNIEHPLDALIPVRYEASALYLTFVELWISALSYLSARLGKGFDADAARFIDDLRRCYADAASVYGRGLSTTRRPDRAPSARLAFVYAVDPHLFCVPSLHVLVVCYTYGRLAELLAERGEAGRYARELAELRARAVAITESILYVRQHSVNCIPTALAMLSVILPSYGEAEAKALISELWRGEVPEADRAKIVEYMNALYDRVAVPGGLAVYDAIAGFVAGYEGQDLGRAVEPELSPAFATEQ